MRLPLLLLLSLSLAGVALAAPLSFKAGAAAIDITPAKFPVRVNGMFTERLAQQATDRLHARALALDDGTTKLVICVVDTCMMPRELIDRAKNLAAQRTGVEPSHLLVSATHTHSAPAAMGCLGSREDPEYAAWLPGKVAEAIVLAINSLQPARIGWSAVDDWEHTHNRRWIYRHDRIQTDPFGESSVRAMMHPGYESLNHIGPSGPVDPQLSLLALQTPDGKPLAVLANYSQHYFGSPLLSSDYYGAFCRAIATHLGQAPGKTPFVAIMSQGTSGDLAWMDYSKPKKEVSLDAYAEGVALRAMDAYAKLEFHTHVPLGIVEKKLVLAYRLPDPARLAWAQATVKALHGRLPQSRPEIYAQEALYLHEKQKTEIVLQALRIGNLGITALPNEVFALTGLKLKGQSPFRAHFNISLANGADGYIPPPEQHFLGGYTTWPARTAGLEVKAEPMIVESLLSSLEELAGTPRRSMKLPMGTYGKAVTASSPAAYWRMEEATIPAAHDEGGQADRKANIENGVALFLEGPAGSGFAASPPALNRAFHFAGGRVRADLPALASSYTAEFWFWNGLPYEARPVTAYLFSTGIDGDLDCAGDHLGIGGTSAEVSSGTLFLYNGNKTRTVLRGKTTLPMKTWTHVVMTRSGSKVCVYLNGSSTPEIDGDLPSTLPSKGQSIFLGGRCDQFAPLEGKLDEVALYPRVLRPEEIELHYQASGEAAPKEVEIPTATSPLSPEESLKRIHLPAGISVALAAAEPLIMDPVAFDWDAKGRLWVVEMADYPLGMDGNGQPGGRVRILEDTNGDSRYDKATLFAEGLRFPTGILTWRDGCLITAAPEVLLLEDKNLDGKADRPQVLLSGFLEGNQQLRVNGLRWGLDGWVYCANGGHTVNYGKDSQITSLLTGKKTALGSRDFRFKPDTGELEPLSGPAQFGRNRDAWGHWFGVQNSNPFWHYALEDRYLQRNPHVVPPSPKVQLTEPNARVYPVSAPEKRFHSFDQAGRFTSACSAMIYGDIQLFKQGNFQHAFVCEPFHNLVQHLEIRPDGATFKAERVGGDGPDFFASEDRWCRPVMARTGPDGALWIADMYRYMIEHPQWLPDKGKNDLLPHYRKGDDRGRIYRISSSSAAPAPWANLHKLSSSELVSTLESSNAWLRDKAHMMLLWRADKAVAPALSELAAHSLSPLARVHSLWLLQGLGSLEPGQVVKALMDSEPGVRENALLIAEKLSEPGMRQAAHALSNDADAKVRLQLAFSLGEWTGAEAGRTLAALAATDGNDPLVRGAITSSALPHLEILSQTLGLPADIRTAVMQSAAATGNTSTMNAITQRLYEAILTRSPSEESLDGLGTLWRELIKNKAFSHGGATEENSQTAKRVTEKIRQMAEDTSLPAGVRLKASRALLVQGHTQSLAASVLADFLMPTQPLPVFKEAARLSTEIQSEKFASLLLERWPQFSPSQREVALEALLSRDDWAQRLMAALRAKAVLISSLDVTRQTRLLKHPLKAVRDEASLLIGAPSARQRVLDDFAPALKMAGNASRGKQVFALACVACHQLEGAGLALGPDLRSVVQHPPEKLFTSILDPSANIEPGFTAYYCELKDGSQFYGIVSSEAGDGLTLRLADGSIRPLLRRDIKQLQSSNASLMPDGLEALLTPQSLADLIAYLREPK